MSGTVTTSELNTRLTALANAMREAGVDPTGLTIQPGSRTYGRAFRLYFRDPITGGLSTVPGMSPGGYLGMTKNEAHRALCFLIDGMRLVSATR